MEQLMLKKCEQDCHLEIFALNSVCPVVNMFVTCSHNGHQKIAQVKGDRAVYSTPGDDSFGTKNEDVGQMLQAFGSVLKFMSIVMECNKNPSKSTQILHIHSHGPQMPTYYGTESWKFDEHGVVTTGIDYNSYSRLSRKPSISFGIIWFSKISMAEMRTVLLM